MTESRKPFDTMWTTDRLKKKKWEQCHSISLVWIETYSQEVCLSCSVEARLFFQEHYLAKSSAIHSIGREDKTFPTQHHELVFAISFSTIIVTQQQKWILRY
jgi:hypothetical protein